VARPPVPAPGGIVISPETSAPGTPAVSPPGAAPARATFGAVFAVGEFRALWIAQILSVAGDQLARVALTLLVYDRTHSALLAAVTFAASVVPTFVGGLALSGLADRLPRREVLIACDVVRCGLVLAMAVPGMPVAVLVILLFLVTMVSAPFTSARAALYADILGGDTYVLGTAVTMTTIQVAQVAGFAVGGAAVAFAGVRASLLADAATFLLSGLIIRCWVRARPAPAERSGPRPAGPRGLLSGITVVFADPGLRIPMFFGWLVAFLDAQEGVAAPLAASLGAGAVAVGLILGAGALGTSAGVIGFGRLVAPAVRQRWTGPLAITSCGVLILFAFSPALPWVLVILTVSGLLSCYQIAANAAFVTASSAQARSQAFGVALAGMSLGQGAAMILAGAAAQHHPPSVVIAASGVLGVIAATGIVLAQRRR